MVIVQKQNVFGMLGFCLFLFGVCVCVCVCGGGGGGGGQGEIDLFYRIYLLLHTFLLCLLILSTFVFFLFGGA